MLWTEILSGRFAEAVEKANGVCAMAVGCLEHHGRHLPLGQDVLYTEGILERAAEKEPVVIFPPMYFGEKQGAGEYQGTVIFSSKLIFDILTESCAEMARNGFKKIVLVNGHGGNTSMLSNFARSVLYDKNDYMVFVYRAEDTWPQVRDMLDIYESDKSYFPELTESDIEVLKSYLDNPTTQGHGGLFETAMTLGIRPDLADLSKIGEVDGRPTHILDNIKKAGFYTPFGWMADYPNSLASVAYADNNERIGRSAVKLCADKMARDFKVLKEDTACEAYLKQWLKKQK